MSCGDDAAAHFRLILNSGCEIGRSAVQTQKPLPMAGLFCRSGSKTSGSGRFGDFVNGLRRAARGAGLGVWLADVNAALKEGAVFDADAGRRDVA